MRQMLITALAMSAIAVMALLCCACADSAIDSNTFTYPATETETANDFHLEVAGVLLEAPESNVFPNRSYTGGKADFTGNTIPPGGSHNVKVKTSGSAPKPTGYFTKDGKKINGIVKSKALDGTTVAYHPSPLGGIDVILDLRNDYGSPLSGTCAVYVNVGYESHFNLADFDTPWPGSWTVMPTTPYSFSDGDGFLGIAAHLNSEDEFVLIVGTADAGDGAGPLPFTIALSPVEEDLPLGLVRRQPNGTHARVTGTVTLTGSSWIYIEEPDRSSGIRVQYDDGLIVSGDELQVYGILDTVNGERVIIPIDPPQVLSRENRIPDPFGMRVRDVGGHDMDIHNPGVSDGRGALNVGLKVTVSGMVTAVEPSACPHWFYIWDGSNKVGPPGYCGPVNDGTGNKGIRIETGILSVPWTDWVEVTGVVSADESTVPGRVIPRILPTQAPNVITTFDMIPSGPPMHSLDALMAGANLFGLPAAPAATGDGDPSTPEPWEAPVIMMKDKFELDSRLYRWESANQSQYLYEPWCEPEGEFGGLVLGDGYWLFLDSTWSTLYSAHRSPLDQWISACMPGTLQIGLPRCVGMPLADIKLHDGGQIKTIRDASQFGDNWICSTAFWWDSALQSQFDVGLPEEWPYTDTMYAWHGYMFSFNAHDQALIIPGEPQVRFEQIDFEIDDQLTTDSSWGNLAFTFTGSEQPLYLNLVTNGAWTIQDVPVLSVEGTGVSQTVNFAFDLGVPNGTDVTSIPYYYTLTTSALGAQPTGIPVMASVQAESVVMSSGIQFEPLIQPVLGPILRATQAISAAVARPMFPNQECGKGECVPAAVSNSLQYLNLGMTAGQTSIGTMKTATGFSSGPPPGCSPSWPTTKDNYMKANGYPVNTATTNNWDTAMAAVNNGADVEIMSNGHCAAVTGITKGADGKYTITIKHDTKQGQAGGTKSETVTYDPATGKYSGGAGFNGSTMRPITIETKK